MAGVMLRCVGASWRCGVVLLVCGLVALLCVVLTHAVGVADTDAVPRVACVVRERIPHDSRAFTQGLFFAGGALYETTGRYGHSGLRQVEARSGRVMKVWPLSPTVFGEGATAAGERIVMLTWKAGRALVFDPATERVTATFTYDGEGWGLTWDGQRLWQSDGSQYLTVRDVRTFAPVRRVEVTDAGRPVRALNELEWVDGEIWANVWHSDSIAVIDPATGVVTRWVDCASIARQERARGGGVLNGIAWDAAGERLYVTGKNWGNMYVIDAQ